MGITVDSFHVSFGIIGQLLGSYSRTYLVSLGRLFLLLECIHQTNILIHWMCCRRVRRIVPQNFRVFLVDLTKVRLSWLGSIVSLVVGLGVLPNSFSIDSLPGKVCLPHCWIDRPKPGYNCVGLLFLWVKKFDLLFVVGAMTGMLKDFGRWVYFMWLQVFMRLVTKTVTYHNS